MLHATILFGTRIARRSRFRSDINTSDLLGGTRRNPGHVGALNPALHASNTTASGTALSGYGHLDVIQREIIALAKVSKFSSKSKMSFLDHHDDSYAPI